jgi:dihydropteroate synthase
MPGEWAVGYNVPMSRRWDARETTIATGHGPPRIMGIVNVTPDSFSDGGRLPRPDAALAHARSLVEDGAQLLDVGGESSRPGAEIVSLDEEIRRVIPAVEAIAGTLSVPISVDTSKVEVARRALAAGAAVINDITALTGDPEMTRLAVETGAGVVLMHMPGTPRTMQLDPRYDDVVTEVYDYLARRAEAAVAAGIAPDRIALDPGIGFGKTTEHNLLLLRNLNRFASLGYALLIGSSRKGFLAKITGRPIDRRATASAVSALAAAVDGADVVRVHDVAETADALNVWGSVKSWDRTA